MGCKTIVAVATNRDCLDAEPEDFKQVSEVLAVPVVKVVVGFIGVIDSVALFPLPGHVQYKAPGRFEDPGELGQRFRRGGYMLEGLMAYGHIGQLAALSPEKRPMHPMSAPGARPAPRDPHTRSTRFNRRYSPGRIAQSNVTVGHDNY